MSEHQHTFVPGAALLVIDVQRALFEKSTPIYRGAELLQTINLLVDHAHQAGVPVIFIQHINKSFLAEGSAGWQLHPVLEPAPDDLILTKQHGSALQETPLHGELQARGVDTLVVTGLVTHGCVKATCEDAQRHGYQVVLVADGHSSYHKDAAGLVDEWNQKLSDAGVRLISAGDFNAQ